MLKVGITGGIGSGKSTVCRIFGVLGVPIYQADIAARELMQSDPELIEAIHSKFGEKSYPNGILDRKYLASLVFSDPNALSALNALVHPVTLRHARSWMEKQPSPYVIKEAALMFESAAFHELDHIVGVSAPQPLRISRAMKRDGATRDEILSRMKEQIPEDIKMRLCDEIIYNDEQQMLIPQVLHLHHCFLDLASTR